MLELDEKDVRAVADARLVRKWWKYLLGLMFLCLGGTFGLDLLLQGLDDWREYLGSIPVILFGVIIIFLISRMNKEEKSLVEEWRRNE